VKNSEALVAIRVAATRALLRHLLDGVHHIRHIRIGDAVERRVHIDFPGDRLAAPGQFLHRLRGPGADGLAKPLPVLGRLAIGSAGFGAFDGKIELAQGAARSALRQVRAIQMLGDLLLRHPAVAIFGFPGIAGTLAHSDHPSLAQ